ncbi:MAG: type II toxin-antitoxin system RelE/ParE family toxin [Desulfobacterales bacterium]|nr:type II toxin-antitoxin system RelE/ParE family toxin [Desulfobacterales bacterium]
MNYKIIIEKKASKEATFIPQKDRIAIDKKILALSVNPRPQASKKLTEKDGYRIRVGNYRILYTIDDEAKMVVIYRIKTRSEKTYK